MLETLDLGRTLDKEAYRRLRDPLLERMRLLQYELQRAEVPTVVVFEGVDAAGKGTLIRRLVEKLDPRLFRVIPAMPPSEEEARRHFLWRFQMRLPADGTMAIFDRSWYGRLQVERIDGRLPPDEVRRSCQEIRDFERWLADDGQVLVKFWLHISKKTQKKRLKAAEKDPLTAWRVSKEDWRHHRQYDRWIVAAEEMIEATDAPRAPWTLVPAQDGRYARIEVLRTLVDSMEDALARRLARPAVVSRTELAVEHTKGVRARKAAAAREAATTEAEAAGLPMVEAPPPPKPRRRRVAKKRAAAGARRPRTKARRTASRKTTGKAGA